MQQQQKQCKTYNNTMAIGIHIGKTQSFESNHVVAANCNCNSVICSTETARFDVVLPPVTRRRSVRSTDRYGRSVMIFVLNCRIWFSVCLTDAGSVLDSRLEFQVVKLQNNAITRTCLVRRVNESVVGSLGGFVCIPSVCASAFRSVYYDDYNLLFLFLFSYGVIAIVACRIVCISFTCC